MDHLDGIRFYEHVSPLKRADGAQAVRQGSRAQAAGGKDQPMRQIGGLYFPDEESHFTTWGENVANYQRPQREKAL
jgi:hypothetical protein